MSNWSKSVIYGGIYTNAQSQTDCLQDSQNTDCKKQRFVDQLEKFREEMRKSWKKTRETLLSITRNLKNHVSEKQEIYWPVFIAVILLLFVFVSKAAFAKEIGSPNNLPIENDSKLNVTGFKKVPSNVKISLASAQNISKADAAAPKGEEDSEAEELKNDIAKIVKNTPMAAMIDPISEKDRTVAAFIVGIAMKESKFGVYAPHIGGRDCYNYWGIKAGGKTIAGGYTCFSSPDEAVSVVSKNVEKMVAKGVRTPAQAISWKCGSSCAGHDPGGVRKWISDVAINFNKINS